MGGPKKLYENQKHISFQCVPRNANNPYNTYNRKALQEAMNNLSSSALKLYLYFGTFKDITSGIYLSKRDAMAMTGLSRGSYFNSIQELEEKGYIIPDDNAQGQEHYVFYESPISW